jgi:hypothetical protein
MMSGGVMGGQQGMGGPPTPAPMGGMLWAITDCHQWLYARSL